VVPSLYLILEDVRGLFSLEEEAEPVVAGELQALPLAAK